MPRFAGQFLDEVGRWCQRHGWPCLDSVVVKEDVRIPGHGYFEFHQGGIGEWRTEVARCILFKGYPDKM